MENIAPAPQHIRRLRDQVAALLSSLEALPKPESFLEISRAANAVIKVAKAIDLVFAAVADIETKSAAPGEPQPVVMNRHARRQAAAQAKAHKAQGVPAPRHASG